jgi:hypothetical protein
MLSRFARPGVGALWTGLRRLLVLAALAWPLTGWAVAPTALTPQDSARVWVNTSSHVYHCATSRYFGTTKRGQYLSEGEALRTGNRPAGGRRCSATDAAARSGPPRLTARPETEVWVNTSSGVYHCAGSRYFEATKRGRRMAEADAQSAGYRPAAGRRCG